MTRQNRKGEAVATTSADFLAEQIARLKELFPEVFTEGKVDWDKLRATLGDLVDDGPERYTFTWAGKRDAIRLLQTPTRATLVPCRGESVNFDQTQHLFIEGDNLEVLKLLYKPYFGRVKMIYIDPPYNTGNDFIYPDNYADPLATYLQLTGQQDAEGNLLTSNPETSGRYHSAWLSMMYPRLFLARQLLREDGVIFVSIDDHEVHNLRLLMNEVFGEENFVANIVWQKRTSPDARATLGAAHDSILVYAHSLECFKAILQTLPLSEDRIREYNNPDNDPRGSWASRDITGQTGHATPSQFYEITTPGGITYPPPEGRCWAISKPTFEKLAADGRIWFGRDGNARPRLKLYLSETKGMASWTWWPNQEVGHNQEATKELNELMGMGDIFDNPKPTRLMKRILQLTTNSSDYEVVLDFFAGSCTIAQAVLELNREDDGNRRFIMVQLPEPTPEDSPARQAGYETIANIGKERIRRVIAQMQQEREGQLPLETRETPEDLGFKVFKLAPSNYQLWRGVSEDTPDAYAEQMALFADPLVDGWTAENVIYEVALKEGYGLNCQITPLPLAGEGPGVRAFRVTDPDKEQSFTICLDNAISLDDLSALNLGKDDLFICRDVALDDEAAANLALQCRLKTI
jgi:adenine-specific DNA-methyltransferase